MENFYELLIEPVLVVATMVVVAWAVFLLIMSAAEEIKDHFRK